MNVIVLLQKCFWSIYNIFLCFYQDVEPGDEDEEQRKKKKEAEKRERKKEVENNKIQ